MALLQRAFTRDQYLHNVCQVLLPTSKEAVLSLTSLFQLLPRSIIFNTDSCVTNNAIESHHLQGFLKIRSNPTFLNEKTEVQRCQGHRTQSDGDTHLFGIIFQHGLSFSLPVCVKAYTKLTNSKGQGINMGQANALKQIMSSAPGWLVHPFYVV